MKLSLVIVALILLASCKSLHEIPQLPKDQYHISAKDAKKINAGYQGKNNLKLSVESNDSAILFYTNNYQKKVLLDSFVFDGLLLKQRIIDIDVFTIPFKIRPRVNDFPPQLNPNFSAAIYLGKRLNYYRYLDTNNEGAKLFTRGIGYGIFTGLGAVTMNPYVTNGTIDYEYDGIVVNSGAALIFDAKKFNLGLSIGTDFLLDKNKRSWLYHTKAWLGILFGIDLN
ncbi:MAG TPA: hypothetical protein VNA26_05225 [Chitinophagaceae bacterium]|nr:hypothetical protein [Chitinophagaceae bacterium]